MDFGQAFYGSVKLKVSGPKGTRVQMHTSFNVTPQGLLNDANDRSALNRDVYTLKGQGLEVWHPRFKGNATRYVQVEVISVDTKKKELVGEFKNRPGKPITCQPSATG